MKEWAHKINVSSNREAMPIMNYPGLALANKTIMDVITDGDAQYKIMRALAKKYPSIAATTIMDLSVEAEAFGADIRFSDGEVPSVIGTMLEDDSAVLNLKVPAVGAGRTGAYLEAARLSAQHIQDRPTFGGVIGPYSLAGRLYNMSELMMALITEPETAHALLEKCTDFLVEYAKAFKETGCNGIIIAEPAAGVISPEMALEFSSNYVKRIVDAVQDDYFMVILHNCGNTTNMVAQLLASGSNGYHFGDAINMMEILPQMPSNKMAFGNISPAKTFKNGTVEQMESEVLALLDAAQGYKNFVLSSGCDVPPGAPLENIDAFYTTLAKFNKDSISKTA